MKKTPYLKDHTWRMLKVPDQVLGLWGHCWHHELCAWLKICQELPILDVHIWRILYVFEQLLRGWVHPWHRVVSKYVIIYLCAKFQLTSMIRNVSKKNHPPSQYLEDIDSSITNNWRMWSSLTSCIIMIYDFVLI